LSDVVEVKLAGNGWVFEATIENDRWMRINPSQIGRIYYIKEYFFISNPPPVCGVGKCFNKSFK